MTPSLRIGLGSWGAVTALGRTARRTALFLRAGKSHLTEVPFIDVFGERTAMALAPGLPLDLNGPERLAALAIPALLEALDPWHQCKRQAPIRTALCLPDDADAPRIKSTIESAIGSRGLQLVIESVFEGRAAGAHAIKMASDWLINGDASVVIVGGVDSQYDGLALARLASDRRLIGPETVEGFIPGEAAAFLVLAAAGATASPTATLEALGIGSEPAPLHSEEATSAVGLTQALSDAVGPLRAARRRTNAWLTDLTHEPYKIREFQIVIARFGDVLGTETALAMPLRELGDVGAATLPLLTALAAESWHAGYAADDTAVCLAGSDGRQRGALLWRAIT